MILTKAKLLNFRNLERIELDVSPQINIFLGRNGQGKTNLLEGLSYLALGRSHRGARDRELIRFGEDHFHASVEGLDAAGDPFRLEAAYANDGGKRLKLNGETLSRSADLVGHESVVLFNPDEIDLTKGGPDHRRRFLDYTLSLISAEYFRQLLAYRRALAQKNRLLRERAYGNDREIEAWDEELAKTGTPLVVSRHSLMGALQEKAAEAYVSLAPTGGKLGLKLEGSPQLPPPQETEPTESWREEVEAAFRQALQDARQRERMLGHAIVGPHRDRLQMKLRGRSLRRYGSQGEMRTAAIALKLAQAELLFERTRERPVVVLDDIFSELDRVRTEALHQRLHREHQLFIATARVDHVLGMEGWDGMKAWRVEGGTLTPIDDLARAGAEMRGHEEEASH